MAAGHGESSEVVEGAREIAVSASSFAFDPDEIEVVVGDDVAIVLTWTDILHDFTIDDLDAHVAAAAGETATGGLRADEPGSSPPLFYAACKRREHPRGGPRARQTDSGIVVVNVWETEAAHDAFNHRMRPHLETVGMGMPYRLEHLWVGKLGWD